MCIRDSVYVCVCVCVCAHSLWLKCYPFTRAFSAYSTYTRRPGYEAIQCHVPTLEFLLWCVEFYRNINVLTVPCITDSVFFYTSTLTAVRVARCGGIVEVDSVIPLVRSRPPTASELKCMRLLYHSHSLVVPSAAL